MCTAEAAIRAHCLDCSGGSVRQVDACDVTTCKLWRWRHDLPLNPPPENDRQISLDEWQKERKKAYAHAV